MTKLTSRRRSSRVIDQQPLLDLSRTFDPGAIDLDDLAEAMRQLLESGENSDPEKVGSPHLHLKRRRVSHVMGSKEAPAL